MGYQFTNNWPYTYTLFPTMVDHTDPVNNTYFSGLHTEVENIEDELGLDPAGNYNTVADRLNGTGRRTFELTVGFTVDCDYICDGTADQVQINQAISSLSDGGIVILREGTYDIANKITINNNKITLTGQGQSTILSFSNAGDQCINGNGISYFTLSHLYISSSAASTALILFGDSSDCDHVYIHDIFIVHTHTTTHAIRLSITHQSKIYNNHITTKHIAISVYGATTFIFNNYLLYNHTSTTQNLLYLSGCSKLYVYHNSIVGGIFAIVGTTYYSFISFNHIYGRIGGSLVSDGIIYGPPSASVPGPIIINNSIDNRSDGIDLTNPGAHNVDDSIISNNIFTDCFDGIEIGHANIRYTMLHGNHLYGTSIPVNDSGTNTRKHDNIDNTATRTWLATS